MMSVGSKLDPPRLTGAVPGDSSVRFGRPVVFGPAARPLVGRLHETRAPAVGSVVLCSPWGYEENCAFGALQMLARKLAESGFETLRFDYDGCGNSWGDFADDDRVASWVASCGEAIEFMTRRASRTVRVVGLRLGAALAVLASAGHDIDRAVLWDPVVSGKRYLRALRAMSMMGVDAGPDPADPGGLVTIGHSLSSATVQEIERLDLQLLSECRIGSALVVSRPGGSDPLRLAAALGGAGVNATVEECTGTELLLDCAAEQSVIPVAILERIVNYITGGIGTPVPFRHAALPFTATLVAPVANGWTEEHFSIGALGMAAVLTLPRKPRRAGVVLMVNNGVARSIGPARAWVEWARMWADLGIASLRLDLSGLGAGARRSVSCPSGR
jgi:pimeloyl-ACP methyl ester carboxylesterase